MHQPHDLRGSEPLLWSSGTGDTVWALLRACAAGDVDTVRQLLDRDPALIRAQHHYRRPLWFAVRENRLAVARLLLERDPHPSYLAWGDSAFECAEERGYPEMLGLLRGALRNAGPAGEPVARAIRGRDLGDVRRLLDADPSLLHQGDARSNQPIHWAVMTRQLDLIDELADRGADLDAERQDHARPVHLVRGDYHYRAWMMKHPATPAEVLARLRERGATVDIGTAAWSGDLEGVRALLDADPSLAGFSAAYQGYYLGSGTALRNAAATGHLEIVRLLLNRGADPNQPEEGIAPHGHALYAAVYHGHHEIARLLLEHGAYPSPEVESSADALSIALLNGDERMVELLCAWGSARSLDLLAHYGDLRTAAAVLAVDPARADSPSALGSAAGNGHAAFVRLLLRHCPDLAARAGAVGDSRLIAELLLDHGADPGHRDWLGITPLHRQAERGNVEVAAVLLERGADLAARDDELRATPLGYAARAGRRRMVEFLLRKGARPRHPDDPPWAVPIEGALRRGHAAVAAVLERAAQGELPAPPALGDLEKLAVDVVSGCARGDEAAIGRIAAYLELKPDVAGLRKAVALRCRRRDHSGAFEPTLEEARQVIAVWSGAADWNALAVEVAR